MNNQVDWNNDLSTSTELSLVIQTEPWIQILMMPNADLQLRSLAQQKLVWLPAVECRTWKVVRGLSSHNIWLAINRNGSHKPPAWRQITDVSFPCSMLPMMSLTAWKVSQGGMLFHHPAFSVLMDLANESSCCNKSQWWQNDMYAMTTFKWCNIAFTYLHQASWWKSRHLVMISFVSFACHRCLWMVKLWELHLHSLLSSTTLSAFRE